MDKQLASKVLNNLNTPSIIETIQEVCEYQISQLRVQLETEKDSHKFRELQGAIWGIRRLKAIRDEAKKAGG